MRSRNLPPRPRAYSQLNRAVRPPPMCRKPVGEGAKRVTISLMRRPCTTAAGNATRCAPYAYSPISGASWERRETGLPMSVAEKLDDAGRDFIRDIVAEDLAAGRHKEVVTRFPPEPNGYLHIGHAKSICLNFGIAQEFGGHCNLRFDDTNPTREEQEYIDAIEADVRWLGFDWGAHLHHASDYFEQLYEWAEDLVRSVRAYVDDLSADEIREYRGTLTEPGRNSPYRERAVDEN